MSSDKPSLTEILPDNRVGALVTLGEQVSHVATRAKRPGLLNELGQGFLVSLQQCSTDGDFRFVVVFAVDQF
jgi:hypothetical protein